METEKKDELLVKKAIKALEILHSDSKFEYNIREVRFIYNAGFPALVGSMRCRRGCDWYLTHGNKEIFLGVFKDKFLKQNKL